MKKILITGASGLLGSVLCRQLVLPDVKITAIFRGDNSTKQPGLDYFSLDVSTEDLTKNLPTDIDVVIYLAQSSKFRDFPDSALDVFNVNVAATARLLDYAKQVGVKQFVFASSGGVYGNGTQAFKENSAIAPPGQLGYYLGSKACGEILVQSYASLFQVTIIRPFFIYGPGQNQNMLIPRLMDSVASGKPISLQGSEGIHINPVHVEDASAAVVAALNIKESATYNIAGPDVMSIRQISEAMGEHLSKAPIFEHGEGVPKDLIADISLMREQLWEPKRKLSESLKDIAI